MSNESRFRADVVRVLRGRLGMIPTADEVDYFFDQSDSSVLEWSDDNIEKIARNIFDIPKLGCIVC